jgi:hypothetical protein
VEAWGKLGGDLPKISGEGKLVYLEGNCAPADMSTKELPATSTTVVLSTLQMLERKEKETLWKKWKNPKKKLPINR